MGYSRRATRPGGCLLRRSRRRVANSAWIKPEGVRLTLAHLDRAGDMTRDQALRWAELLPRWLGVDVRVEGKGDDLLGGPRKR